MRPESPLARFLILGCAVAVALSSCSSAPKSGKRPKQTILLDTTDDIRVGKEASLAVTAQIGLYEDAALESYVDQLGQKLLRGVPRHGFQYQFKITPQVEIHVCQRRKQRFMHKSINLFVPLAKLCGVISIRCNTLQPKY